MANKSGFSTDFPILSRFTDVDRARLKSSITDVLSNFGLTVTRPRPLPDELLRSIESERIVAEEEEDEFLEDEE
jgi:hypothetical protein